MQTLEQQALGLILPKGVFEWFDIIGSQSDDKNITIILEEKNIPPLTETHKDQLAVPKGFTKITITDFPIRGKKTLLTFKRRYWKIEGQETYLKNDIKLSFPGTLLEQKFADFLKAGSRNRSHILGRHSQSQ
jgi:hypothetical protein